MKRNSPMRPRKSGYLFIAPYVVLLVAIGIYPAGYVVYLALTSLTSHFTVLGNFIDATHNSEFVPAFENIIKFLATLAHSARRLRRQPVADAAFIE